MYEKWKQEELEKFNIFRSALQRQVYFQLLEQLDEAISAFEIGDVETAYRHAGGFTLILEQLQKEGYDLGSFSKITEELQAELEAQPNGNQMP